MSVSPSESSSSENYFIDKDEEKEKELVKNDSVKNIENYIFENKDVEMACQDFLENIFQVNPRNDDPLRENLTKNRKISDTSNYQSSRNNTPNAQSKRQLNSNSNFNSQRNDIHSNSSSKNNLNLNPKDSEKENNLNLANSQNNVNKKNSASSSGRSIICKNFVDDL